MAGPRHLLLLAALAACRGAPPPAPTPGSPAELTAYLTTLAGADEATRTHAITGWVLDEAGWRRTVVDSYAPLWADYAHGFDAQVPALVTRLAAAGPITARRHFAGDPRLTLPEARLRWAVPVQFPSLVAELGGTPIDAVFVYEAGGWRVLAGVDELVLARVRARDPACADRITRAGAVNKCTEVAWLVADSALRDQADRFAHACQLAATLCANGSP